MNRRLRYVALAGVVALVAAAVPHQQLVPAKYALVIGVSDYQYFEDEPGGDLPGAANDARAFTDVLIGRLGVPESNIHMVLDLDATRARIQHEMTEWLPSVLRPGDLVWIFFAGHGSQTWDVTGDEADGLDETVCPTDVSPDRPNADIRDDELDRWLSGLPAAEVILIWDKCHAESSMRAATPFARARVLGRDVRDIPRPTGLFVPREERTGRGLGARAAAVEIRATEEWRSDRVRARGMRPTIIEVAASQADQVAMDAAFPGVDGGPMTFGGAFTTSFVRNFWQAPAEATLDEVFRRTANDMRAQRFEQRPMLTDSFDLRTRSLASLAAAPAEAAPTTPAATPTQVAASAGAGSVPVLVVAGNRVVLDGGSAAGITSGSIYSAAGRLLRVTDVAQTEAIAQVAGGAGGGALGAGTPAQLVAYAFPSAELRVSVADLPAALQDAIVRGIGDAPTVRLIRSAGEFAHVLVRQAESDLVVLGLDGFPRHRIAAGNTQAAVRDLGAILQGEARAHQLAGLDNPARPFQVEFGLDDEDNDLVIGDLIRIQVTSERSGYLTIIDLPADGTVTVVFPTQPGQDNYVAAGQAFSLPRLSDPAIQVTEPVGRSIVRAFVTERPMTIGLGPRDPQLGVRVLEALSRAAGEAPLEDSRAIPVGSWASASIVYDVLAQ